VPRGRNNLEADRDKKNKFTFPGIPEAISKGNFPLDCP
jgi:hypothetical protein